MNAICLIWVHTPQLGVNDLNQHFSGLRPKTTVNPGQSSTKAASCLITEEKKEDGIIEGPRRRTVPGANLEGV